MSSIWFILNNYDPTTPGYNRFDGLAKGMVKRGYRVGRVYIWSNSYGLPDETNSQGIREICLWKGRREVKGKLRHIFNIIRLYRFLRSLPSTDRVIATNTSYLYVYSWFKQLHVYIEKSEYPELHMASASLPLKLLFKSYLSTCRKISGMLLISESLKDYYISKGVSEEKILVVNMTVDSARFVGIKKKTSGVRYIAYCGAVSNYKDGVDVLIKSFAEVVKTIPEIKLYIIGAFASEKDKEQDLQLVEDLGLMNRVVFTGNIDRTEMPQILVNAESLVLARPDNIQAKYGFPTKLGEYLLTGNPVVVTSVGEIPLFLKDNVNAFLAQPGDLKGIASKICESLTSEKANLIGERGKQIAMENFNSDIEADKILKFIYG